MISKIHGRRPIATATILALIAILTTVFTATPTQSLEASAKQTPAPVVQSGRGVNQSPPTQTTPTLVSNAGQGDPQQTTFSRDHGQIFTTGYYLAGHTLDAVQIVSEDGEGDDIALKVCTVDTNDNPTSTCDNLTPPTAFDAGPLTFTAPTSPTITLSARTEYMIVLSSPGSEEVDVKATGSSGEDEDSPEHWSIADTFRWNDSGTNWTDSGLQRSIVIRVEGTVNDPSTTAPTSADQQVTFNEDTSYTFRTRDFSFNARTSGDRLASVTILSLPHRGSFKLDAAAVTANQSVTIAQINAGSLTYTPAADAYGTPHTNFLFRVVGSTQSSDHEYRLTVNVSNVQDAATGAPSITAANGAHVGAVIRASATGIADVDGPSRPDIGFQWVRGNGSNPTDITDATRATYHVQTQDIGHAIRVRASFTDNIGKQESAISPPTGPVGDPLANFIAALAGTDSEITLGRVTDTQNMTVAAQSFTTGSSATSYTLERVSTSITGTGSHSPRAYLYTDTSDAPGNYVATLSRSGSTRDDINQFSAPSRTSLDASTTYWIVFHNRASSSSAKYDLHLTDQSGHDNGGSPGWTMGDQHKISTVARTSSSLTNAGTYTWTDGAAGTAVKLSITASIALTDQPSFPDVNSDGNADAALFYIRENSRYNTFVGAVTADDSDNDRLNYSLAGTGEQQDQFAETFTLNASNGRIQVGRTARLDYEARKSYEFQVTVTDREDDQGNTETLTMADDTVDVTIKVSNLDEPGVVAFVVTQPGDTTDPENPPQPEIEAQPQIEAQPEIENKVTASLTDPDESVANITWQWSRSTSRGGRPLDIPNAATAEYTVELEDHNYYLTATARYDDGFGKGRVAQGQSLRVRPQSQPRSPMFDETEYSFSIAENARGGASVGQVTTHDNNLENVTYTLYGPSSNYFSISASSGQIRTRRPLDHESHPAHQFMVDARDASNLVTSQEVAVGVTDVDERETLTVSDSNPRMELEIVAHLNGGDHVSAKTWQWAAAENRSGQYTDIPGATSPAITPMPDHLDTFVDKYLRVTVTYTDPYGAGKTLEVSTNRTTDIQPLLFSNVQRTANGQTQINNGNNIAQKFRTGSAGYTVNGVGVSIHSFVTGQPSVIHMTVHAASDTDANIPGAAVFNLPVNLNDEAALNRAVPYNDLNRRTLEPNTTYFLVIGMANNGAVNLNTTTSTGRDPGTAAGWSITNQPLQSADQGATWTTGNGGNAMFVIYGEPGRTPYITEQRMISQPLAYDGNNNSPYGLGERIEIQFTFDQPVRAPGNLSADIMIGTQARKARHVNLGDSKHLIFAYDVQPDDSGQFTMTGRNPIENNAGSAVRAVSGNRRARLELPRTLNIAEHLSKVDSSANSNRGCDYVYCAKVNLDIATDTSEPGDNYEYRLNEDGSANGALARHTFQFDNAERRVESIEVSTVDDTTTLRIRLSSISSSMRRQLSLLDHETHRPLSQARISNNVIEWTITGGERPLASQLQRINFIEVVEHQPHGRPTITGTLEPGYRLTASVLNIKDKNALNDRSFTYQWQRNGSDVAGATGNTYNLTTDDANRTIRVRTTFQDMLGNVYTLTSDSTERVAAISSVTTGFTKSSYTVEAPEHTYPEDSFGIPIEWRQPDSSDYPIFTLAGSDAASLGMYQASGSDENGLTETINLYSNVELDYETRRQYRVQVVATKDDNSTQTVRVTINVKNEDDPGWITFSGDHDPARVGKTVRARVEDPDGAGGVSWHWQRGTLTGRGWTDITGATGSSYRLTETDLDHQVRATANYTDRLANNATLAKRLDAILPAEVTWIDGNLNILKNGRPITLEYNSSNEVEAGDQLTANTSRLLHPHRKVGNYYYRWTYTDTSDNVEQEHIGTAPADTNIGNYGNARTFTVPSIVGEHLGISVTVAWRAEHGPINHSTYAFTVSNDNETTSSSGGGGGGGSGQRSDETTPPGVPESLQVALQQSGRLRAAWNAPGSGPTPTGYTVQWKAAVDAWDDLEGVSQTQVTKTSYVIGGLIDGVEYTTRVVATRDGADSDPSAEVTVIPQETTPPELSSASVDGSILTLAFNEELDHTTRLSSGRFAANVNGSARSIIGVTVHQSNVLLDLSSPVAAGDTVTVNYTAPTDASEDGRVQDLAGNLAASFRGQAVTNHTPAPVPLTASEHGAPTSHDGSATFTFELRFSEEPADGFSYKTLRDHAFTVTGGEVAKVRRLETGKNIRWEISVSPDGTGAVTIALPATTDCDADGAVCTEDGRMLSSTLTLTVPGPNG